MKDIQIDCYDGAYGPTIRFVITSSQGLERVRGMFMRFLKPTHDVVEWLREPLIVGSNIVRLTMRGQNGGTDSDKTLVRTSHGEFDWLLSKSASARLLGLVDGLESCGHGHQYLTSEGIDDALVILSYKERENMAPAATGGGIGS
jgi:hypothetical protein